MDHFVKLGVFRDGRVLYRVGGNVPVIGYIAFGVIDRGTNVLQVRPTTICPQNCAFCSVDAGPFSKNRWAEYVMEPQSLIKGVEDVVAIKTYGVEVLIDTIGDPLTYPHLLDLVKSLKEIPGVKSVALETHGALLTRKLVDRLSEAGLDRINASIDTLNAEKARFLYGISWYDLNRTLDAYEYLVKETPIDLHVTPVWIPGVNDEDVIEVVKWAYKIGAGKKWPPATVQKYVEHKYGRKIRGVRPVSWEDYWRWIDEVENKTGLRVKWTMEEWGMRYDNLFDINVNPGDVVVAEVLGRGWVREEFVGGVENGKHHYLVALYTRKQRVTVGERYYVKIKDKWDTLIMGEVLAPVKTP